MAVQTYKQVQVKYYWGESSGCSGTLQFDKSPPYVRRIGDLPALEARSRRPFIRSTPDRLQHLPSPGAALPVIFLLWLFHDPTVPAMSSATSAETPIHTPGIGGYLLHTPKCILSIMNITWVSRFLCTFLGCGMNTSVDRDLCGTRRIRQRRSSRWC